MIECRTIPRITELAYAALVGLFLVVGLGFGIGGLVGGLVPAAAVGWLFVLIAFQQGWLLLFRTASEFAFEPPSKTLFWRSTLGHGSVPVEDIEAVKRSTRPGVYSLMTSGGDGVDFWLDIRNASVQGLFEALRISNPSISTRELYRKGRLWWRGLPSPR